MSEFIETIKENFQFETSQQFNNFCQMAEDWRINQEIETIMQEEKEWQEREIYFMQQQLIQG